MSVAALTLENGLVSSGSGFGLVVGVDVDVWYVVFGGGFGIVIGFVGSGVGVVCFGGGLTLSSSRRSKDLNSMLRRSRGIAVYLGGILGSIEVDFEDGRGCIV
jgi:hypothetical protein